MNLKAHGDHEFDVYKEIIIIKAYDAWNIEHTQEYFDAFKAIVKANNFKQWGVLVDFGAFKGATPEVFHFFNEKIIPWSIENGQVARAHLVNDLVSRYLIEKSAKGNTKLPVAVFETKEEAFSWFKSFGLTV